MRDDFAVFILSHGRADRIVTLKTLEKCGYTGKIYIVIDDQDETADDYFRMYGDSVIQFCKNDVAEWTDSMDMGDDMRVILYARNVCFKLAKELGLKYFLELDDDYDQFRFRIERPIGTLTSAPINGMDRLFEGMLNFLDKSGAVTVAFAQNGDFIGGVGSNVWKRQLSRKAMNSFFCRTDRPFKFQGRLNEDVNAYTLLGSKGLLFFTVAEPALNQLRTQANADGMTDVYLKFGTYVKSFYTIIAMPSAVKVSIMNSSHKRIHHKVMWDRCVPQILNESYRKPR